MEIRIFQIIVPFIALLFIANQFFNFRKGNSTLLEVILICFFWIGTTIIALFPDFISKSIASFLGIKDNINALVFLGLGLVFYFQLQIYKITQKQDAQLTELTRKTALANVENEPIEI